MLGLQKTSLPQKQLSYLEVQLQTSLSFPDSESGSKVFSRIHFPPIQPMQQNTLDSTTRIPGLHYHYNWQDSGELGHQETRDNDTRARGGKYRKENTEIQQWASRPYQGLSQLVMSHQDPGSGFRWRGLGFLVKPKVTVAIVFPQVTTILCNIGCTLVADNRTYCIETKYR